MNTEDLLHAIGHAEEKMLEQSEKRKTKPIRTLATIAAVLCLCMVLSMALDLMWPTHWVTSQTISGYRPEQLGTGKDSMFAGAVVPVGWERYQYQICLSIEAKVKEVFPDVYTMVGGSTAYRVLRLKVVDEIVGNNFPREIYYLMPVAYDADLMEYDSLIMSVEQLGCENYWLYNTDQDRLELFDFVFTFYGGHPPAAGSILAYKDGKMDTDVWSKQGWDQQKNSMLYNVEAEENPFPVKKYHSISEAKEQIRAARKEYEDRDHYFLICRKVIRQSDYWLYPGGVRCSLAVHPLTGNVYTQTMSSPGGEFVIYTRVINGYRTNEQFQFSKKQKLMGGGTPIITWPLYEELNKLITKLCDITINGRQLDEEVLNMLLAKFLVFIGYSVQFTDEDLENLPNIDSAVEAPMHYLPEEYQQYFTPERKWYTNGYYYKVGDAVYGVVSVNYGRTQMSRVYIVIYQDGSYEVMDYDALENLVGRWKL